jgi:hypothetical protein
MPTGYIRKLSKEGKGSVESLEKKWDEAKAAAKKEGKGENFAYITSIFQKLVHASTKPIRIEAMARLRATEEEKPGESFDDDEFAIGTTENQQ